MDQYFTNRLQCWYAYQRYKFVAIGRTSGIQSLHTPGLSPTTGN